MDDISKLTGTMPEPTGSGRVWKIQKKRKTEDRNRENKKQGRKESDEKSQQEPQKENEQVKKSETVAPNTDEHVGYGPAKTKKKSDKTVDLVI